MFRLAPDRLDEIFDGPAFQCHKTVDYDAEDWDENPSGRAGEKPQQCAGLIATLRGSRRANAITRAAMTLTGYDLEALDPDHEAYESVEDAHRAHAGEEP